MRVKLGEVAKESRETLRGSKRGLPVVGLEHIMPGELALTEWDVDSENTFIKTFRKGQMLFGRRRAYLKKAAIAPFDGVCSGDITVIESIAEKLTPDLLPFIIQNDTFFDYAVGKSTGSLSPRVKWEHLQNFEFNLPSIAEQHKLASLLWAANSTREAYKKLLAVTDELIKSQFVEMFGGGDYLRVELRELCSVITKGTTPTTYGFNFVDSGVNFLKVENITEDGYVSTDGMMFVSEECHEKQKRSQLHDNDIVFSIAGALGRCAIVTQRILPANTNQALAIIRLDTDNTNTVYVLQALRSSEVREQYELQKQGIAQLNLSLQNIGDLRIPLPPLDLQNRFAEFVRQADKSKFVVSKLIKHNQ